MTGNQIKGKGFRGALRYNLAKVERNVAEILYSTFARSTEQGIMKEVQMVRSLRPRLQKYFYHTSINFPPDDNPDDNLMKAIGQEYLDASGFLANQYIMFRHRDAGHPHLHILVNRIGYDGSVVSDSNDFQRSEKVLRNLEVKYNLTRVAPSREAKRRAVTKDEREMMKRTSRPSNKVLLQKLVGEALKGKSDIDTFISELSRQGVKVVLNKASTGHISGISYELDGFRMTGSKLGAAYKWSAVKRTVDGASAPTRRTDHSSQETSARNTSRISELLNLNYPDVLSDLLTPEMQNNPESLMHRRRKRKRKSRRR